jgi:serine/threonine protein kinase/tetratricopeptide (TPR) repeat protein
MPGSDREHPGHEALRAFLQGRVGAADLTAIERHLEGCETCRAGLEGAAGDDVFMARLREAGLAAEAEQARGTSPQPESALPLPNTVPAAWGLPPHGPGPPIWPDVPSYEILSELGRGGVGVVYKARQGGLNRLVALKVLLAGAHASPEDMVRFRAEAEAAARLRHPNVIQVYEVGTHEGLPYVALEFVEGGSLADHTHGRPQPPREAARLIEALARGVQAAHDAGIVHRDLKPTNVLLSFPRELEGGPGWCPWPPPGSPLAEATPRVTDFGLAKWLTNDRGLTGSRDILGTPSYMAPEQAGGRSKEVGPAADIYALGAILYECLTGRPPFQGAALSDILVQVLGSDPLPPRRLTPGVPRDLETVCLKCLHKEPHRRYARAADLADDLGRYRDGRSVHARPSPAWEKGWRWARRHPAVAALLAAIVLLTVLGVGAVTWKWREAEANAEAEAEARRAAVASAAEARRYEKQARAAVANYYVLITTHPDLKAAGAERLRKALLAQGVEYFKEFVRRRAGDLSVRTELAAAHHQLGLILAEVGDLPGAVREMEQSLTLRRQLAEGAPADTRHRTGLGVSLVDLGGLYAKTGRPQEGKAALQKAVALFQVLAEEQPAVAEHRGHLAVAHNSLGVLLAGEGRREEARAAYAKALGLRRQLVRERPGPQFRRDLADVLNSMAILDVGTGAPQAVAAFQEARALLRKVVAELPADPQYRRELAVIHHNLGNAYSAAGKWGEAEAAYKDALAIRRPLAADHPTVAIYRTDLAQTHQRLGVLWRDTGRPAEAEAALDAARALFKDLVAEYPTLPQYRADLAAVYEHLDRLYLLGLRFADGEAALRKALRLREQLVRAEPASVRPALELAGTLCNLGSRVRQTGAPAAGLEYLDRARAVLGDVRARAPNDAGAREFLYNTHYQRAETLTELRRYAEAVQEWDKALALDKTPKRFGLRLLRAVNLAHLGERARAVAEAEEVVRDSNPQAGFLLVAAAVHAVAAAARDEPQAERYAARAVALLRRAADQAGTNLPNVYVYLSQNPDLAALRARADFRKLADAVAGRLAKKQP